MHYVGEKLRATPTFICGPVAEAVQQEDGCVCYGMRCHQWEEVALKQRPALLQNLAPHLPLGRFAVDRCHALRCRTQLRSGTRTSCICCCAGCSFWRCKI